MTDSVFRRYRIYRIVSVSIGATLWNSVLTVFSAVTTLLLERGFKVRVATRSASKQQLFHLALEAKYGLGSVELVEVDDYESEQSWDRMLRGKSVGVAYLVLVPRANTGIETKPRCVWRPASRV